MVNVGAGRHLSSLEDPTDAALQLLKWNSVYQVLNVTGAFFTKLSIGLFLLRLKNTKRFSRIIWVFLAPLALTTAALDLVILLQCIPLEALWNQALHSRCISEQIPLTVSYVQSGFAIVTDLFLTISPVVILWKVRISVKRKAGICGLMSLGLMATISNALRNAYIPNLIQADFTCMSPLSLFCALLNTIDTIVPIVIVADLEFSLGVIAACIPTLMPLFRRRDTQMPYSRMTGVVWHGNTSGGSRPKRESSNPFTFDGPRTTAKADLEQQRSYVLNEMGTGNGIMLEHSYTVERAPAM